MVFPEALVRLVLRQGAEIPASLCPHHPVAGALLLLFPKNYLLKMEATCFWASSPSSHAYLWIHWLALSSTDISAHEISDSAFLIPEVP